MIDPPRLFSGGRRESLLFLICFTAICAFYEFGRVMRMPPLPTHIWRQADCLSITTNLFEGHGSFLEPEMFARIADHGTSGQSAGEAPVLYWLVAQVWRFTGKSEFVYRCVGLLFLFLGLLALFRSLRLIGLHLPWALGLSLLMFCSPALVYYSLGFITDVPAFAMALIGFYFFARFWQEKQVRWWALAMVAFAVGASMKVTAGLGLLALLGCYALWTAFPRLREPGMFPRPAVGWATALASVALVVAWYIHADHYNQAHGGRYTFNGFWPLWKMNPEEIDQAIRFAQEILVFQVFDTSVWILLALAFAVGLSQARRWPSLLVAFNALVVLGTATYVILWFNALDRHDYYFINPLMMPLVILVSVVWWLHRQWPRIASSKPVIFIFLLLVGYNVAYARNNLSMRSNPRGVDKSSLLPLDHAGERLFWRAEQWGPLDPLIGMDAVLDSAGIPKSALVAVPEDGTINASLYLLDRPGLTGYGGLLRDVFSVERFIALGGRYLLLSNRVPWADSALRNYMRDTVLSHRGAVLYDLSGLPFSVSDTVLLSAGQRVASSMVFHMDTIPCSSSGIGKCISDQYVGFAIDDLPLGGQDCSILLLEVSGSIQWERPSRESGFLTLFQHDLDGVETIDNRALADGPFRFTMLINPKRSAGHCNLVIENQTGAGYRLALDEISVRRILRPWS